MSTRATISTYRYKPQSAPDIRNEAYMTLYKHWDGYLEGTLPQLTIFCKRFQNQRGMTDISYLSARLVQYMANDTDETLPESEYSEMLGFGIYKKPEDIGGTEYHYCVYPFGIDVYNVIKALDGKNTYKFIKTITIKEN